MPILPHDWVETMWKEQRTTESMSRMLTEAVQENIRLQKERDLAVRVAAEILPTETLNHLGDEGEFGAVTYEDIRQVMQWADELDTPRPPQTAHEDSR